MPRAERIDDMNRSPEAENPPYSDVATRSPHGEHAQITTAARSSQDRHR